MPAPVPPPIEWVSWKPVGLGGWVGGWFGWVGWVEEKKAVRMSCWTLWVGGWVGGWEETDGTLQAVAGLGLLADDVQDGVDELGAVWVGSGWVGGLEGEGLGDWVGKGKGGWVGGWVGRTLQCSGPWPNCCRRPSARTRSCLEGGVGGWVGGWFEGGCMHNERALFHPPTHSPSMYSSAFELPLLPLPSYHPPTHPPALSTYQGGRAGQKARRGHCPWCQAPSPSGWHGARSGLERVGGWVGGLGGGGEGGGLDGGRI